MCIADIEQFHLVTVHLVDTDCVLWRANLHDDITNYLMLVHIFGKVDSPFGSNWELRKILKF